MGKEIVSGAGVFSCFRGGGTHSHLVLPLFFFFSDHGCFVVPSLDTRTMCQDLVVASR
jgi:hypothetical protein